MKSPGSRRAQRSSAAIRSACRVALRLAVTDGVRAALDFLVAVWNEQFDVQLSLILTGDDRVLAGPGLGVVERDRSRDPVTVAACSGDTRIVLLSQYLAVSEASDPSLAEALNHVVRTVERLKAQPVRP